MARHRIGVLVGSLREGSFTRRVARHLTTYPTGLDWEFIEIGSLPLYNEDLETEGGVPPEWAEFREQVKRCDGLLFATPEYNRSIPGALKNALDVGSRPYGASVWDGKPAAVISVSPGAPGAFGANHHLRQALVFLNVPAMAQPEAYIGRADRLFADDGRIREKDTDKFLRAFTNSFKDWVERLAA